jgi:hypothetical protein
MGSAGTIGTVLMQGYSSVSNNNITNGFIGPGFLTNSRILNATLSAASIRYFMMIGSQINGATTGASNFLLINQSLTNPISNHFGLTGTMQYVDGNQAAGKVLTSDASGNATWQPSGASSAWSLTGNAGTNSGTNFIGTLDTAALEFATDGVNRMQIDSIGDVSIANITVPVARFSVGQSPSLIPLINFSTSGGRAFTISSNPNSLDVEIGDIDGFNNDTKASINDGTGTIQLFSLNTRINDNGNFVGIGTAGATLSATLTIGATGQPATIQYIDGNQAANKVLTSDASGNATWQTLSAASTNGFIGTSATPAISGGSGAGTSPTLAIQGTNIGGQITVTPGLTAAASSTLVTITYASLTYPNDSYVVLYPANSATALLSGVTMVFAVGSTTNFIVTTGTTALTPATAYSWNYIVIGK